MGRNINRLSSAKVRTATAGRHPDGGGLYLQVTPGANGPSRSWIFRYTLRGRERFAGLGPLHTVSLAEARDKARALRRQLLDGIDPLDAKRRRVAEQRVAATTFREAAARYIASHERGWRGVKNSREWTDTLERFAHPVIGALPVGAITVDLVLKCLEPHWATKTETMSR